MHIRQMQASYQTDQDRILLRLNTFEGDELRIWLTRRMIKALLPHLNQLSTGLGLDVEEEPTVDTQAPAGPEPSHAAAAPAGDFSTPFEPQSDRLPLGEEPLLTTALHVAPGANHGLLVRFDEHFDGHGEPHRSVETQLEPELLGGLVQLLGAVLRNADWGMSLPSRLGTAQAQDGSANPRTLDAYTHHGRPKYLN